MVECCRWIYARALPDWSCPTKKLIEMIPIVSRMCLTDYFGSLESIIIDRLKNATLHVGLRFAIQALEICEAHHADRNVAYCVLFGRERETQKRNYSVSPIIIQRKREREVKTTKTTVYREIDNQHRKPG